MNRKLIPLIILVLCIPMLIGGVWMLSMTGDAYTVSNVSLVRLVLPDGQEIEYLDDKDKELFVDFKSNIVSIENQIYDENVYSLYRLDFERVKGDATYYLCLSADVKNCLAYDEKGNWYRIDKEYAKKFLILNDVTHVYRNSSVPCLSFTTAGETVRVESTDAEWYYLLADESYSEIVVNKAPIEESVITVMSHDGFEFAFDTEPDWYNVKIYSDGLLIHDGMLNSVTEFSNNVESDFRAVISAEWYDDTNVLYNGQATYEFVFSYDIKASYSLSKESLNQGEALYINISHADGEELEVTSDIPGAELLTPYSVGENNVVVVPIPMDTKPGEYKVSVNSNRTSLLIPFTVTERNFGTVSVGFVGSESASEYNEASKTFREEISKLKDSSASCDWIEGMLTPVPKYVDGVEQYWVSAPSYGVTQKLDGTVIDERSLGIHYVKSIAADELLVRSVAQGTVAFAGETTLYGNTVVIDHGLGIKTVYGHLESYNCAVGGSIGQGATIGIADPSGFAVSSTEFFFGVCVDGIFLNPYNFIVEPRSATSSEYSEPIEFLTQITK